MDGDVLMFAQVMIVIVASTASFVAIGFGAVFLWRKSSRPKSVGLPHDDERMQRLETAVDTIAIEVERISEAQRFMVGLLSDPARVKRELARPDGTGKSVTPH